MEKRTLTITVSPDWRGALREAGRLASAEHYQGETLNFESPGTFLGRLSARRWALVQTLLGAGEMPLRELARHLGRDVKRVHEDIAVLAELGLVERSDRGGVLCPLGTSMWICISAQPHG
ncbi:transcriptional regulator [Candidatus Thiodictyon syntrophicum]|jgi:predicted transcriptional regulator|uniref:HVO_A0114 family putative DNA-binding protein n=1 Tax=Candidatus Thiodictyon syntrophicum TaxID=1166950 RepID=UPI001C12ACB8|nr:transcriptional regulator [Candidatus Thiodictyon syntrophicum]